jgi:hypothetical protein
MSEGTGARVSEFGTSFGRFIDYMFGRNSLIGLASMMLLAIAGYATWSGMNDFIVGVAATTGQTGHNVGGVQITSDFLVVAVCVALTFLMWLALRETFGAQRRWTERMVTFPLYLFLVLWSIGFGYGFWWSLIAGVDATRTSMASLQEDARDASTIVAARLDAVRSQLDNVVTWSDGQMSREESSGGSCGVPSGAGRGPLYNARRSVRDSVTSLRDGMLTSWLGPVQADVEKLRAAASGITGTTPAERQANFEAAASDIRGRSRSIAARSNELGKSTAAEMRALAESVSAAPNTPGFTCYDPTLGERLRQAAEQAGQPATVTLRDAAFNEGPAGVANAVKNLWSNIGSYLYGTGVYIASGGQDPNAFTSGGTPITGRDVIALLATIGIDLGLFALAVLNPPAAGPVRQDGLAATQARLHLPPPSVVRQLASAIDTAIARAPGADLEWVRRHFIFHDGASYFVIPNLYSVAQEPKEEELRALAVNQLAGVFSDLALVRALTPKELQRFGGEELRDSYSDLSPFRQQRQEAASKAAATAVDTEASIVEQAAELAKPARRSWLPIAKAPAQSGKGIRNHGLLSKACRALDIAGWSDTAQRDVEIFRLTDTEGLTPLLTLLNEATVSRGAHSAEQASQEFASLRGESARLAIEGPKTER